MADAAKNDKRFRLIDGIRHLINFINDRQARQLVPPLKVPLEDWNPSSNVIYFRVWYSGSFASEKLLFDDAFVTFAHSRSVH